MSLFCAPWRVSAVLALFASDRIACAIVGASGLFPAPCACSLFALGEREKPDAVRGIGPLIADRIEPQPAHRRPVVRWRIGAVAGLGVGHRCPLGVGHWVSVWSDI